MDFEFSVLVLYGYRFLLSRGNRKLDIAIYLGSINFNTMLDVYSFFKKIKATPLCFISFTNNIGDKQSGSSYFDIVKYLGKHCNWKGIIK